MTAHGHLKHLKDKYSRLLEESRKKCYGMYPESSAALSAKELAYETFIDDLEECLKEQEGV